MDYLKKIEIIIKNIESIGRVELAEEISILRDTSFTASELLTLVTNSLIKSIKNDIELKNVIATDVIELQKYCWSIGLHVR